MKNLISKINYNEVAMWVLTFFLALTPFVTFGGQTGTLNISGTVAANTSITVTGTAAATNLDLGKRAKNILVANVQEQNNTVEGYTVTVRSANGAKLKNGDSNRGAVSYTAKYNNKSVNLGTRAAVVTDQGSQNRVVNVSKSLKISFDAQNTDELLAGDYSDTLTFEIQAK